MECTGLVALTQVLFVCFQAFGRKGEEFLVSTVRAWATLQVAEKLGNYCYTSLCCMTVHY